jgi:hypothetical protein
LEKNESQSLEFKLRQCLDEDDKNGKYGALTKKRNVTIAIKYFQRHTLSLQ